MRERDRLKNSVLLLLEGRPDGMPWDRAVAWIVREWDRGAQSARLLLGDLVMAKYARKKDGMLSLLPDGKARCARVRPDAEAFSPRGGPTPAPPAAPPRPA